MAARQCGIGAQYLEGIRGRAGEIASGSGQGGEEVHAQGWGCGMGQMVIVGTRGEADARALGESDGKVGRILCGQGVQYVEASGRRRGKAAKDRDADRVTLAQGRSMDGV